MDEKTPTLPKMGPPSRTEFGSPSSSGSRHSSSHSQTQQEAPIVAERSNVPVPGATSSLGADVCTPKGPARQEGRLTFLDRGARSPTDPDESSTAHTSWAPSLPSLATPNEEYKQYYARQFDADVTPKASKQSTCSHVDDGRARTDPAADEDASFLSNQADDAATPKASRAFQLSTLPLAHPASSAHVRSTSTQSGRSQVSEDFGGASRLYHRFCRCVLDHLLT